MLLLENTGLDSFLEMILIAHVVCTLLNQGDIFSMIIADLMAIRIQEGTFLATLSCF